MDIRDFLLVVIYLFVGVKRTQMGDSRKRELNLGGRYSIASIN